MNEVAENVTDPIAMRRLGLVILLMCGITVGLIVAATVIGGML